MELANTTNALTTTMGALGVTTDSVNRKYGNIEVAGRATAIFDDKGVSNLAEVLGNLDTFATGMDSLKELYQNSGLIDRINPSSTVN